MIVTSAEPLSIAALPERRRMPAEIVISPEKSGDAPRRTSVPAPVLMKPTEPTRSPLISTVVPDGISIVGVPASPRIQMRFVGETQLLSTFNVAEFVTMTYATSPGAGSPGSELLNTSSKDVGLLPFHVPISPVKPEMLPSILFSRTPYG